MKRKTLILIFLLVAAILPGFAQEGAANIEFIENKGQWDPQVNFEGDMTTGAFFLRKNGFLVLLNNPDDLQRMTTAHHGVLAGSPGSGGSTGSGSGAGGEGVIRKAPLSVQQKEVTLNSGGNSGIGSGKGPGYIGAGDVLIHSHAYSVSFVGSNDAVTIIPDKPVPGVNNYFIGNDTSRWASNCKVYQGVTYKNIYPNIDLRYYTDRGFLKYDIIVHPGGDVNQIVMRYDGPDKLSLHKGQLLVNTSVGQVKELAPSSFQFDEHGRTPVDSKYIIQNGNTVRFKISGYDPSATLIIDPTLVFCSFTGSKVSNWGFTATPGPDGSFFAGGIVFGPAYPYNTGALQPSYGGGQFDVGIIKLSANGSSKVYATYLGGNNSETPHSMICDAQGNLVVLGRTYSGKSFSHSTLIGPGNDEGGAADMFVARLDPSGGKLTGCLRIGGTGNDCVNMSDQLRNSSERADSLVRNYGDDSRSEVVLDGQGNILIAASSQSSGVGGGFPIVGNVFQPTFGGGSQDAVVIKIDPTCNNIIWSSFLGGNGADAGFVLKPDLLTGDIYVAGATTSSNFPGDKTNVVQSSYSGGVCDGFVSIISADGKTLKKTSYFGTNLADAIYGIQIDKKGFPYIMGTTNGVWTVTPNVQFINPGAKQFVSKLKPDLSAYVYSTTFGTPNAKLPNISPVAFLVDRCENVYVSGWGGWIISGQGDPYGLSGTAGMPVTPDAIKPATDNRDFYFIVIKKNATDKLYGTFYGQNDNSRSISEHVDGGTSRYDQNGIIYQAICANCNGGTIQPFPTTPGVWSPKNGAAPSGCNEAAVKISFNFAGVSAGLKASVNGRDGDTTGCVPLDAVFQDTVRNALSYIWNFGDGGPDTATTAYVVTHTYNNPGVYKVMLIALDSNSCNGADTVYRYVSGQTNKAIMSYSYTKVGDCNSLEYQFNNTSQPAPGAAPFSNTTFAWSFSDQQPPGSLIPDDPLGSALNHTFAAPGSYIVDLILLDPNYCNYPDTVKNIVRASPITKAQFTTPPIGCAPYTAVFNNTSLGGTQFTWDFGDGNTSTDPMPTHVYADSGHYTIKLHAFDPSTCNQVSDTSLTIYVSPRPKAAYTYAPSPPIANTPMIFTNESQDGVRYIWGFGDGDTTVKSTMDTVQHLYISTGNFNVCLVTVNQYGCTDTACQTVATLIDPLLDVPNAFTPGRFGQNGVIKVVGFGITDMTWRIYNRYGQLVFQSNDPAIGWDGTYQGVLQPLGVYAYTLEAAFSDGKHATKKGDITLVR